MEQDKLYNCIYKFCLTLLRTIILRTTNIGFCICIFLYMFDMFFTIFCNCSSYSGNVIFCISILYCDVNKANWVEQSMYTCLCLLR